MKLRNWIRRIPRPARAIFCTVCAVLAAVILYTALNAPVLTLTQHFRRAEKVHMVGPSQIVDRLSYEQYNEFDGMLVGETDRGIIFFGRYYGSTSDYGDPFAEKKHILCYQEKNEDLTLAPAPSIWSAFWNFANQTLPVYLFTVEEAAVRAEASLTVSGSYSLNQIGPVELDGEAELVSPGVLRMMLTSATQTESQAMGILSSFQNNSFWHVASADISVTVRLYDAGGALLSEQELHLSA